MKKLIFLFLLFAGFMACENETIQELPQETSVTEGINARQGDKIGVCHKNAGEIVIGEAALETHIAHGDAVDRDGDGFYDAENPCSETDCDDANAEVYPGAEEICDNGIDDNCDGQVDEDCSSFTCGIDQNWENFELTNENYLSEDCINNDCGGFTIPRVSFTVLDSEGNRIALFIVFAFDFTTTTCDDYDSFDDYYLGVYYENYQTGETCEEYYGCPDCGDSNMGPGTVELYNEAVGFINNLAAELGIEESCADGARSSGVDSVKNMQSMPDELKKFIEDRKALLTPNK